MSKVLATGLAILASIGAGGVALGADAQAGRSVAQSKCAACHDADDWEGEDAASLESLIRDIVAGKVKHKSKLELDAAEIVNIAAYWGQGGKQRINK
jgi:cytochrome c553